MDSAYRRDGFKQASLQAAGRSCQAARLLRRGGGEGAQLQITVGFVLVKHNRAQNED